MHHALQAGRGWPWWAQVGEGQVRSRPERAPGSLGRGAQAMAAIALKNLTFDAGNRAEAEKLGYSR